MTKVILTTGPDGRAQLAFFKPFQPQINRPGNFTEGDTHYMVRCYTCDPKRGRENHLPTAATGTCAWCGDSMYRDEADRITKLLSDPPMNVPCGELDVAGERLAWIKQNYKV